jgi:hypothetical protein
VEPVTTPKPETIWLVSPPIDGTPEEREEWAKALIDAMRPKTA